MADPRLLKDLDGRVDLLMANPPYVPDWLRIPPEYGVHQPPEASFSGADGLDAMRGIAVTAARLLRGGGVLAVEHLDALVDEVVDIIGAAGFEDITSHPDFTGFPRYVTARRPAG
ncbi:class I SAM-dependent methyltransferase [Streptomyces johnsoniae]|uniref:Uncharacterized protein n=1 Tax=Streptomyces johnsoniae TaxID=3075532 RepID=A0ABU2SF01_9ACTN|nr:hypothetical protein [Streptomyces sp. DSM 41886]MDT0447363.1 hypothetical protein [Streptomyces sp. DSM 41886]